MSKNLKIQGLREKPSNPQNFFLQCLILQFLLLLILKTNWTILSELIQTKT